MSMTVFLQNGKSSVKLNFNWFLCNWFKWLRRRVIIRWIVSNRANERMNAFSNLNFARGKINLKLDNKYKILNFDYWARNTSSSVRFKPHSQEMQSAYLHWCRDITSLCRNATVCCRSQQIGALCEQSFSGGDSRPLFQRSWVRIPAPYTGCTIFHIYFL